MELLTRFRVDSEGRLGTKVVPGFSVMRKRSRMWIAMEPLHIKTPLHESHPLSKLAGFPVHLKLENVQPVSSFKIRGLGNLCQKVGGLHVRKQLSLKEFVNKL